MRLRLRIPEACVVVLFCVAVLLAVTAHAEWYLGEIDEGARHAQAAVLLLLVVAAIAVSASPRGGP